MAAFKRTSRGTEIVVRQTEEAGSISGANNSSVPPTQLLKQFKPIHKHIIIIMSEVNNRMYSNGPRIDLCFFS